MLISANAAFGPEWLAAHLTSLVPDYPDVSLCVAVSGGVDSTALLAALAARRSKQPRVRAVHVDHGLHPSSPQWSAHCRSLARRLGVPLQVLATRVKRARGVSLEAAAREARYRLLAQTLAPGEILLTAHQQDDQLETVLLQLLRGSGLAGMAAMPAIAPFASGWLVRPLLSRTRAELEAWVRARGLRWIEDETNADERLDRNYLRRRVLPLIRARWPGSAAAVTRSARHAAEAQRLLDLLARADVECASYGDALSVKALRALAPDRRRNALRFWIAGSGWLVPETRRLEEIAGPLLDARADANPCVAWGNVVVQRHADLLSIRTRERDVHAAELAGASPPAEVPWPWRTAAACDLPLHSGKLQLKRDERGPLDLDALPDVLTIRWRQGGERLRPRRGGPRRALKSLLQEAHVSVAQRAHLPLIFSGEQLIAVADLWLDESVQATPAAQHRARLLWTN